MKKIKLIGLVLENQEIIWINQNEMQGFEADDISKVVVQFEQGTFEFDGLLSMRMNLKPCCNHTYNSFGTVSRKTIFQRLMEVRNPMAAVRIKYDDDSTKDLFFPGEVEQIFDIDSFGGMDILCYPEMDDEAFYDEEDPEFSWEVPGC